MNINRIEFSHYYNNSKQTINCNKASNSISFGGYYERVQARRCLYTGWQWFWWADDKSREIVKDEMKEEIKNLQITITKRKVTLESKKKIYTELCSNHAEVIDSLKKQMDILKKQNADRRTTITAMEQEKETKETSLKEQNKSNRNTQKLINEQKETMSKLSAEISELRKKKEEIKPKAEISLKRILTNRRNSMEKENNERLSTLSDKISSSITSPPSKIYNSDKQFPDILGYQSEISLIKQCFGTPLLLEQENKPAIVPNGILIHGPINCGKENFAKAIAKEYNCFLIELPNTYSDYANLKNIKKACIAGENHYKQTNQRTIIFINDFDKFAPLDSSITNPLKGILDNISKKYHCTIIATTTNPKNIDSILLRDGRFDIKLSLKPAENDNLIALINHYAKQLLDFKIDTNKIVQAIRANTKDGKSYSNEQIMKLFKIINENFILQNVNESEPQFSPKDMQTFQDDCKYLKNI